MTAEQNPDVQQNPDFQQYQYQQQQASLQQQQQQQQLQQQPDLQQQQLQQQLLQQQQLQQQQQQLQQQQLQQQHPPPPPPPAPYSQYAAPQPAYGQYQPPYYTGQPPSPYPYVPPGYANPYAPQYPAIYPPPGAYPAPVAQPQTQRPLGKSNKILWIGNLHQDVKEEDLSNAFSRFGQIEAVKLVRTKACGFVTFTEPACAMDAHDKMGTFKFHGQDIKIGWGKADQAGYQPNPPQTDYSQHDGSLQQNLPDINRDLPPQPASRTLWIGNVTPQLNETVLREYFGRYGAIEYVRLWVSRHCAFITFQNETEATNAKQVMDRQRIGDTIVRVNYGKA